MLTLTQTKTSTHVLGEHHVISSLCFQYVSVQSKFNFQYIGAMTLKLVVQFLLQEGVGESLGDQLSSLALIITRIYLTITLFQFSREFQL